CAQETYYYGSAGFAYW
nr:immunoglobulin heavy chain junction region [Mus musculus]